MSNGPIVGFLVVFVLIAIAAGVVLLVAEIATWANSAIRQTLP